MPKQAYVFAQFLGLLPRYEFQRIVNQYNGDYRTKHFKCWHQLACMMFAHIRQENSLRDIDTPSMHMPASSITSVSNSAALYKSRWEIELFFKWVKQNLRVKTFYGTSPNAVKTQIWIAMIVYLMLAILKQHYALQPSLSKLLHFLEVNLFEQKPLTSIFQPNARASRQRASKQMNL